MATPVIVVAGDESASYGALSSWTFESGSITLVDRLEIGDTDNAATGIAITPDGTKVWFGETDKSANATYLNSADLAIDGTLSNRVRHAQINNWEVSDARARINNDGTRLIWLFPTLAGDQFYLFDIASDPPVELDSVAVPGGYPVDAQFTSDGSRVVVSGGNGGGASSNRVTLYDVSGDAFVELDTLATFDDAISIDRLDDTTFVVGYSATIGNAYIADITGDTVTNAATITCNGTSGEIRALSSSRIWTPSQVLQWNGSSLSQTSTHSVGGKRAEVDAAGRWVVCLFTGAFEDNLFLIDANADAGTAVDTRSGDVVGGSANDLAIRSQAGPTTDEELFQASYADASAAPPKVTALISPADVQRSIDTDVNNLKGGPKLYTVDAIIPLGELEHLRPGNVFSVQDDQPGLRTAKNLLLKSYRMRSADPTEPVSLTLWG